VYVGGNMLLSGNKISIKVLEIMTPCSLVDTYQHLGGEPASYSVKYTLKVEAAFSSETLYLSTKLHGVTFQQSVIKSPR